MILDLLIFFIKCFLGLGLLFVIILLIFLGFWALLKPKSFLLYQLELAEERCSDLSYNKKFKTFRSPNTEHIKKLKRKLRKYGYYHEDHFG